jgi:hypothetical protein
VIEQFIKTFLVVVALPKKASASVMTVGGIGYLSTGLLCLSTKMLLFWVKH